MFGEDKKQNRLSEHSFHLDSEYSYIKLLQEDPKYNLPSQLKVQSKIRLSTKNREKSISKKPKGSQRKSRSYSRKKSKAYDKEPRKNKKSSKKLEEYNSPKLRKVDKQTNPKAVQKKQKSNKSLKTILFSKPSQQCVSNKQNLGSKNNKNKIEISKRTQKAENLYCYKSKRLNRLKKIKSQTALDFITLSQIQKKPVFGVKQSKVLHEYFGIDKLSSIVEIEKKSKKGVSKLSKCKTHSSSLSAKNLTKFKVSRQKK